MTRRASVLRSAAALALLAALVCAPRAHATSLADLAEGLDIDRGAISASGVSSGGYMAQQFHVAHSLHVMGVAVIAGGPYGCATGVYRPYAWFDLTGLYAATSRCSNTNPYWIYQGPPDVEVSLRETRIAADAHAIDDPRGMRGDRVWLLSGDEDETVPPGVVDALERYYREFVDAGDIRRERIAGAAHAMITQDYGNPCSVSAPPFVNDCDFDAAGQLLAHIYGSLHPQAVAAHVQPAAAFDQTAFFDTDDASVSMHRTGHVYVPRACAQGARCRLHVAFHGCRQSEDLVGDAFYARAGYNAWAETNRVVVLYPQVSAWGGGAFSAGNPRGCWDWWGYGGDAYHHKDGKQIRAVAAMINALLRGPLLDTGVAR